jgi:hypothetical protein
MPEEELLSAPRLKRGRRFDWLYERMVTTGRLESVLSKSLELPAEVWRRLNSETDAVGKRECSSCFQNANLTIFVSRFSRVQPDMQQFS